MIYVILLMFPVTILICFIYAIFYKYDFSNKKMIKQAETDLKIQIEKQRRDEILKKAEKIGGNYCIELNHLYNQQGISGKLMVANIAMTDLTIEQAYRPVKNRDPYIRGGAASALGGPALGAYTALKTDEQNKRELELRQQAKDDLGKRKNEERNSINKYKNISQKIQDLENLIEYDSAMLDKASKLGENYYSDLKNLYVEFSRSDSKYSRSKADIETDIKTLEDKINQKLL